MKHVKHWRILSNFFFTPWFLLVLIALTATNTIAACFFHFHVGRINLGTFGVAFTFRCSGDCGFSMLLTCSISDSMSAMRLSSLSFALSKSPFQLSQSSVSEMLSDALFLSVSTGWWLIPQIRRTLKIWVRPPGRSIANKDGGKRRSFWQFKCSRTIM